MRTIILVISISLLGMFASHTLAKPSEFPGRTAFPKAPIYELTQLRDNFANVAIVDTRSKYEFSTLRVKNAINIPIASKDFISQIKKLKKSINKPIVFYCNGRTCYKSYLATQQSIEAGITDVFSFDAGIIEWALAHPDQTILLGKSPIQISDLISKENFNARLLNPDNFSEKILELEGSSMVLDVRDKYQRAGIGFYPGKERWISLDDEKNLEKIIRKAKSTNKTLFVYDEVGKQVRWLQYALERHGIKKYFFMEKGAKAYYTQLINWK